MFTTTMLFALYLALLALYVFHFKPCLCVNHFMALCETTSEVKIINMKDSYRRSTLIFPLYSLVLSHSNYMGV